MLNFLQDSFRDIYDALESSSRGTATISLEVQKHLGNNWVRCVAMDTTDGLQRNLAVHSLGTPIKVPVGPATLDGCLMYLDDR